MKSQQRWFARLVEGTQYHMICNVTEEYVELIMDLPGAGTTSLMRYSWDCVEMIVTDTVLNQTFHGEDSDD